jgi:hypothetical protein
MEERRESNAKAAPRRPRTPKTKAPLRAPSAAASEDGRCPQAPEPVAAQAARPAAGAGAAALRRQPDAHRMPTQRAVKSAH